MTINKQALLRAAVKVGAHTWEAEGSQVWSMSNGTADSLVLEVFGDKTSGQQNCDIASFIAEASPANVLALLDELEESQALGANESACADSTINLAINWQMRCKDAEAKLEAAEERYEDMLRQARSFREAHDSASELIRKLERNNPVVKLPTTKLWAGKVACYEESEIIALL
ncbi:TPA: ead/Ea22-like family protein, partial [Citrobacter freundii]|nr:ead/Ea22-like family protein [Citrobacter freundii]HCQ7322487.1 ead/Ea22-like family protein [Citrobacter freundii]